MIEGIITGLYTLAYLIKNKILAVIILTLGLIYLIATNYLNIDIIRNIDFNSIMILLGTYGVSKMFLKTNFIEYLINSVVERASTYKSLIILLMTISFIVSGLINNIIVLAFLIPLIEEIIKKNNIKSELLIENIIISSILGSISTLTGSNNTIIMASYLNMNFLDFFFYDNRIGIYIITLIMFFIQILIVNISVKNEDFIGTTKEVEIKNQFNVYLFLTMIALLLISSLINIKYLSGITTILCLIVGLIKNKKMEKLNYDSIIIYALMFIYISIIKNMAYLDTITNIIIKLDSQALIYTLIFVISIGLSFVCNQVFVFYFLTTLIPKIVLKTNLIPMPLIYITYFGLIAGLFKRKEIKSITAYQTIICMLVSSYFLVAFLYF